jgi:hypothetical protein
MPLATSGKEVNPLLGAKRVEPLLLAAAIDQNDRLQAAHQTPP